MLKSIRSIQKDPLYQSHPRPGRLLRKGMFETEDGRYRFIFFSRENDKGVRSQGWDLYHLHQSRWKKVKGAKSTRTLRAGRARLEVENNNRIKTNNYLMR
jgi:hypothetical protein